MHALSIDIVVNRGEYRKNIRGLDPWPEQTLESKLNEAG